MAFRSENGNKKWPKVDAHAKRRLEARVDELVAMGLDRAVAAQVARGRRELNEVLEAMARADRISTLMDRHGLGRALAVQVAIGHADLEQALGKMRRKAYMGEHGGRTVFSEAAEEGALVTMGLLGHRRISAKVLEVDRYEVVVDTEDGERETLHKLEVKYVFRADDWKHVRKMLAPGDGTKVATKEQLWRIQDRFRCDDKVLFPLLEEGRRLNIDLVEGERIVGNIKWLSHYEIGLSGKKQGDLVVMRHSLAGMEPA